MRSFYTRWTLQIFLQPLKIRIFLIKLTIDLSASYVFCQRYTKDRFLISYLGMPTRFSVRFCAVLEKTITQHALFRLLQSCQKALDSSEYVGTVLMDLSKAYDCIPHNLFIAKLEADGLDKTTRHLLSDYLCDRKQRTKSSFHLQWLLGHNLWDSARINSTSNMLFFVLKSGVCNFGDDSTLSYWGKI